MITHGKILRRKAMQRYWAVWSIYELPTDTFQVLIKCSGCMDELLSLNEAEQRMLCLFVGLYIESETS